MSEIKFRRDTSFRKQFFVPDSFAHPAKMDAQLLIWLVENYTKVGEVIFDPMAGSGTTMLACTLGRNCILVELEEKFCKMMRDNWEEVRMRPQLGCEMGSCEIIQGDARELTNWIFDDPYGLPPEATQIADNVIFSPPFGDTNPFRTNDIDSRVEKQYQAELKATKEGRKFGVHSREDIRRYFEGQMTSPDNIGNLKYGDIDTIITSPPYSLEDRVRRSDDNWRTKDIRNSKQIGTGKDFTYGEDSIGNLSYGSIDKIITSPPYESAVTGKDGIDWSKGTRGKAEGNKPRDRSKNPAFNHLPISGAGFAYSQSHNNIGNLKSASYLEAMLQVYQQCHKVLRDGGLLILVTKNFIRQKQVIRLDLDTIKLCEQAGFSFLERHYRKLPAQSFWRTIYHQKHPEVEEINYEDILVLRKVML